MLAPREGALGRSHEAADRRPWQPVIGGHRFEGLEGQTTADALPKLLERMDLGLQGLVAPESRDDPVGHGHDSLPATWQIV